MRISIKSILIGVVAAIAFGVAAVGSAGPALAQHHHHGGGFGPGFAGGLAFGALAASPYYYGGPYYYGPNCYLQRRVFINNWGRRVVRYIRLCD